MKIIILGAGQVGATLAENLIREENDITLIDTNSKLLHQLQNHLDIRTITGHASHPTILQNAGAEDADMLIAVTNSDETNMIACQVAYSLFNIPTKIARIRSVNYLDYRKGLFVNEAIPIDFCISPEIIVTNQIKRIIEYPGALQVLDFADSNIQLVTVKPYKNGTLINKTLAELQRYMPETDFRVAAIYRENRSIPLNGQTKICMGDEVFFIAAKSHIHEIMQALGHYDNPNRRIFIAGGGNIGSRLAQALENNYQVKLLDHSSEQAEQLSQLLNKTVILLGDASDAELLSEENIEDADVFCALTNDDEANIMSAMLAKRMGARQVLSLITRSAYVDLIQGSGTNIDIAISPQLATTSSILTHIRRGDVVNVHSLRRGAAEAIEAIAHGDENTSKVIGRTIEQIKLPPGAKISAVFRNNKTLIAHHDLVIEAEDHIILFVDNKKHIHAVEQLFQVSATFL